MKIGVVGSMQFSEELVKIRDKLRQIGHEAYVTTLVEPFLGKSYEEKERIKLHQKFHQDAIREFWRLMQGGDAILVLNLDKNGIENYIGGNTLMEIGFAHVLDQKVFLYNPIPDLSYRSEIEAVNPIILYGDIYKIR